MPDRMRMRCRKDEPDLLCYNLSLSATRYLKLPPPIAVVAWYWLFARLVSNIEPGLGTTACRRYFRFLSPKILVISAAVIAAALKIYCAATTLGSCDVPIISRFGQIIDTAGIDYMYRIDRHFNHPPVTG